MFVLTINEIISGVKAKSFFLPIIILFNHISTEEENTDRPGNRKNLILLTETQGKKTKLGRFSSAEKKEKKERNSTVASCQSADGMCYGRIR